MTAGQHDAGAATDVRRLRIQLATLLAAVEDLRQEWEATVELAATSVGKRRQRRQPADITAVLADLAAIMRVSAAFPTGTCQSTTLAGRLPAIENAQKPMTICSPGTSPTPPNTSTRHDHRPLPHHRRRDRSASSTGTPTCGITKAHNPVPDRRIWRSASYLLGSL